MKKSVCYHYFFVGESRIMEIYALYELTSSARKKADELLMAFSREMEKDSDGERLADVFIGLYEKAKGEPQKERIWKAIGVIGDELDKKVAAYMTK